MERGTARELTSATDEQLMTLVLRRQEAALGAIFGMHGAEHVRAIT